MRGKNCILTLFLLQGKNRIQQKLHKIHRPTLKIAKERSITSETKITFFF